MQRMSHSLHLSSGKHSISTSAKLSSADKHNNRKFKVSNNENLNLKYSDLNATLIGTDNIFKDVKELYTDLFDSSVKQFNERQNRKNNVITSYFDKISNDTKQHVAEEIIVQFGSLNDNDTYLHISSLEDIQSVTHMFHGYLNELQKQLPNFKIANATIHFDEANPHLHIIGVPISENNTKGLSTKVSKRSVFSREKLSELQSYMGQAMVQLANDHLNLEVYHDKEKGRNRNFNNEEIIELREIINELKSDINSLEKDYHELSNNYDNLYHLTQSKLVKQYQELEEKKVGKEAKVSRVRTRSRLHEEEHTL